MRAAPPVHGPAGRDTVRGWSPKSSHSTGSIARAQAGAPAGISFRSSVPSARRKAWFTSRKKTLLPSASFATSSPARRFVAKRFSALPHSVPSGFL